MCCDVVRCVIFITHRTARTKEDGMTVMSARWFDDLGRDVHYAWRSLARQSRLHHRRRARAGARHRRHHRHLQRRPWRPVEAAAVCRRGSGRARACHRAGGRATAASSAPQPRGGPSVSASLELDHRDRADRAALADQGPVARRVPRRAVVRDDERGGRSETSAGPACRTGCLRRAGREGRCSAARSARAKKRRAPNP